MDDFFGSLFLCYSQCMSKYDLLILDYGGVYSFEYDQASFNKIMLTVFGKEPTQEEKENILLESRALGANKINVTNYIKNVSSILRTEKTPENILFEDTTISFAFPPTKIMTELVKKS